MADANLKYLFSCLMKDGTIIDQTQEDVSPTNSEKSAFYDVNQRLDDVVQFILVSQESDPICYGVNLQTGEFLVNGHAFTAQDTSLTELPTDPQYRLIYFRRVKLHFNAATLEQTGKSIVYYIGWQTTDADGKNRQQTIAVR